MLQERCLFCFRVCCCFVSIQNNGKIEYLQDTEDCDRWKVTDVVYAQWCCCGNFLWICTKNELVDGVVFEFDFLRKARLKSFF
jgi:hypothetical protein